MSRDRSFPKRRDGREFVTPDPRDWPGRRNYRALKPGQDRWQSGAKLIIKWYPGRGPGFVPITDNADLSLTLDMKPPDASKPASEQQEPTVTDIQTGKNSSSPSLQDSSSPDAPTSFARWRWHAIAIFSWFSLLSWSQNGQPNLHSQLGLAQIAEMPTTAGPHWLSFNKMGDM